MTYYYILFNGSPIRPDKFVKVIHNGKTISIEQLYSLGYAKLYDRTEKIEFFREKGFRYKNGIWWFDNNGRWEIIWEKPDSLDIQYYELFGQKETMEYWNDRGYILKNGVWYSKNLDGSLTDVDVTLTTVTIDGRDWTRKELVDAGYYEFFGQWKTADQWAEQGITVYGHGYWAYSTIFFFFFVFLCDTLRSACVTY